jgi:hypothetical protein
MVNVAVIDDPEVAEVALAARLVREVGVLVAGATEAGKPLATYGLDAEARFASPADRAAFAEELTNAALICRYHDEKAPDGREHRIVIAPHPRVNGRGETHGRGST